MATISDIHVNITGHTWILRDNRGAVAMTKNPVGHKSANQHIDIKHHFERDAAGILLINNPFYTVQQMKWWLIDDLHVQVKPLLRAQFERLELYN